ncbi:MAG: carboxypeptidase M32 [Tissierellia bacterium]|nr:carboxypeptidase M32 [Tissierellia bacterium]
MDKNKMEDFKAIVKEIEYLNYILHSVLYWDKVTHMPKKEIEYRNEVNTYVGGLLHQLLSSEDINEFIQSYEKEHNKNQILDATIRRIQQLKQPVSDIPEDEYRKYIHLISKAENLWNRARIVGDFELMAPYYSKIFDFFKEFAEYWSYEEDPYDALIQFYIEGYSTQKMDEMVKYLKIPLQEKMKEREKLFIKNNSFQIKNIHKEKQFELWKLVLDEIGFDFEAGRLDVGSFTTILSNSPTDVRIVNEFSEEDIFIGIFNVLHSGGKAIYKQKIDKNLRGTLLGEPPSFVMEEAIGRFYENIIGRSKGFWKRILPKIKSVLHELKPYSLEDIYTKVNLCKPSPIRMNADEITYLLHIIIRYEIEKEIISGNYDIDQIEHIWNEKYKEYLGVEPKDSKEGILQDVHWAAGYIGYFPTYLIATVASSQFAYFLEKKYGDIDFLIQKDGLYTINRWMEKNIFRWGAIYEFKELVNMTCGEDLNPRYYLEYLNNKF